MKKSWRGDRDFLPLSENLQRIDAVLRLARHLEHEKAFHRLAYLTTYSADPVFP